MEALILGAFCFWAGLVLADARLMRTHLKHEAAAERQHERVKAYERARDDADEWLAELNAGAGTVVIIAERPHVWDARPHEN